MINPETFWEIRFIDFIPIITTFLSPFLIYLVYKKLNKRQELSKIKTLFTRFKIYVESTFYENKDNEGSKLSYVTSQYFKSQIENLIKIGIVVMNSGSKDITGNFDFDKDFGNIYLSSESDSSELIILDKYVFTGWDFLKIPNNKEKIPHNKEKYEEILLEMINYAKKNYGIKLNKKLAKIN